MHSSTSLLCAIALIVALAHAAPPPRKLFTCSASQTCVQVPDTRLPLTAHKAAEDGAVLPLADGAVLPVCLLTCGKGSLWPLPRSSSIEGSLSGFSRCGVQLTFSDSMSDPAVKDLLSAAGRNFLASLTSDKQAVGSSCRNSGGSLTVHFDVSSPDTSLRASSHEGYTLGITHPTCNDTSSPSCAGPIATVQATHFAGAAHALQTLAQLTAYDSLRGHHVVAHANVTDEPAFHHRGVMVDTARNFLPIAQLQKTIRAMAMNKLNVMHMHISDTGSFPIELSTGYAKNLSAFGAYGPDQYYSASDITSLVQYAKEHAVRIIPEIDAPAHTNEGWQWGPDDGLGELVLCRNGWAKKGLEPPSGQLNLANPAVYDVLDDIYTDIVGLFQSDVYHLGGDEVIVGSDDTWAACWNSTVDGAPIIKHLESLGLDRSDPESFYKLWSNFTTKATAGAKAAYQKSAPNQPLSKIMQWGGAESAPSAITYNLMVQPYVEEVLPPEQFSIQVWDNLNGSLVPSLLEKGYSVVLSHTDYVYLDCGEPGWVKPGGYWCNPFHEWFKMYDYVKDVQSMYKLKTMDGIDGAEVLAWGEEIDEHNFDGKVWPRGAALAEALWSNPTTGWWEANYRMHHHRQAMVDQGIQAAAMQTKWCLYNDGCDINAGVPQR